MRAVGERKKKKYKEVDRKGAMERDKKREYRRRNIEEEIKRRR